MSQAENVTPIEDYKAAKEPCQEAMAQEVVTKAGADMSKVAIFISLLSVLLLVVFFFGLNQNITSLSQEVQALAGLRQDIGQVNGRVDTLGNQLRTTNQAVGEMSGAMGVLGERMGGMETRVVELEKLPAKTRNMVIANDLNAIGGKLGYIGGQLDAEQSAKLAQAQKLLKDLETGLAQ